MAARRNRARRPVEPEKPSGPKRLEAGDVIRIKRLLSEGVKQKVIAEEFNVTPVTISNIKCEKTWAHVKVRDD